MDPYPPKDLPDDKLKALVEYVYSLNGDDKDLGPIDAKLVDQGKKLFADDLDCNTCHEVTAGETADGPTLWDHGSKAWIARVIRNSSAPDLFGKIASMPSFKKKLTDDDIEKLAELVASGRSAKGGS
jgi:mono/diheme cytochrome c family protein